MSAARKPMKARYDKAGAPINCFGVTTRTWSRWTVGARETFNELYDAMHDQRIYNRGPATLTLNAAAWDCIRWNAAWMAACELSIRQKEKPAPNVAVIRRALDAMGIALTNRHHKWSRELRRLYERADAECAK